MNRRKFLVNGTILSGGMLAASSWSPASGLYNGLGNLHKKSKFSHRLPVTDAHYQATSGYIEDDPVPEYFWASDEAYEDFLDMKFGIRLHWGIYSIVQLQHESWPFLTLSLEERQMYQELYRLWDPVDFDANEWMDFFADSGAKMFAFTTKHHDGFSMFDTKTRVKKRADWLAPGGQIIESCDLAYSIMETPFKRDVVKELCDAAHKKDIKIDLYYSHPDWYDADFRPYNYHPLQVPEAGKLSVLGKDLHPSLPDPENRFGRAGLVMTPNPTVAEVDRMMKRHRDQLEELITNYGAISMVDLDQWFGPEIWPRLRETMIYLRKLRPNVMYRARGIGNYGDYYTPEGFVPGDKENTDTPWFVIYPLGQRFAYDPIDKNYKGTSWIVKNVIDSAAKGGNFMVGIGPDGSGRFHPAAIKQLRETGAWLRVNGEGIYATRPREGDLWKEGDDIRFTRSKDNSKVYMFSYTWPQGKLIVQTIRPREGAIISLMGTNIPLKWEYDGAIGLIIRIPSELKERLPQDAHFSYGFKIPV